MKSKEIMDAYNKLILEINSLQKDKDNPYFKSKYVDLNQILDEVKQKVVDAGFCMPQTVMNNFFEGVFQPHLHTELIWAETGEVFLSCDLPLVGATDMQKLGSAITYARRYSLLPMLQLQCEDDDGNEASGNTTAKKSGYDALETFEEFKNAIETAPEVKHLNALYYKWSAKFPKGSPEYDQLNRLSREKKGKLQEKDYYGNNIEDQLPEFIQG